MSIRTRGGKLWLRAGKVASGVSNRIEPTNADLGFAEGSFTAITDQAAGTYLFTAQILNPSVFALQGYTFSNFRRTAGFSKLSGGTEGATSRPFTSNAMVLGDANAVTVTISVDFTGPSSGTISATIPGLIETPPGTGIVLHEFTLHNTGASSITPRFRFGLAFESGAFPDSFKIKVRDQDTQTDIDFAALATWNTWADGSLRSTADGGLVGEDSNALTAGSSRLYQAYITNGGQATSGFDPWAWIAASSDDLTVDVTSRTGSSSGSLGNLAFSLKTAIATTTRREVLCDTARFVRIKAWQKLSGEEHLICEFHVDFWLDSEGDPVALEVAPVLSQHWWVNNPFSVTQTKERQTYNAVVKWDSTTLDSRTSLAHAYYCRWASLRSTSDAQHARKHWIDLGSTAMPTVRVQYADASLQSMMRAGYIPPYRTGVAYTNSYTSTYTPLGANSHRAGINDTGGYAGRGVWGDPDAQLISLQGSATAATAETAWRKSRVMAQAALAVGWHVRDHRSVSGVNGGTDTTNRTIPHVLRKISASYSGLAGPAVYSRFSSQTGSYSSTSGLTVLAQSDAVGGGGAFSSDSTIDNSHAVNYGGPMAFLEGEAYLGDATLSQFSATMWKRPFNQYASDRNLMHAASSRGNALGVPDPADASHYGTLFDIGSPAQERELAWALNLACAAWSICSDARPERPLLQNLILNHDDWLSDSLAYFNTAQRERGGLWIASTYDGGYAPWMCHWQGLVCYLAARLFDFCPDNARGKTSYEEGAEIAAQMAINNWRYAPQAVGAYHSMYAAETTNVTLLPLAEQPFDMAVTVSSNVFTASVNLAGASPALADGDKVRFLARNSGFDSITLPSGLSAFTLYYLVSTSGSTFRLATSPGGSPISVANSGAIIAYITPQSTTSTTPLGSDSAGDTRQMMLAALLEEAIGSDHADLDPGDADAIRTFFASAAANTTNWSTWNYDGSGLE